MMNNGPNLEQVVGQDEQMLVLVPNESEAKFRVHSDLLAPLSDLQEKASKHGFQIEIISAYRSYERQLAIWNGKVSGDRPILDSSGQVLDQATLSPKDMVMSILRWSALPGASRHHWGTDLDVVDAAAMPSDYSVQLTPEEFSVNGVFGEFRAWLDELIATKQSLGFFRPYASDFGGVAPEPWHISYAPLASQYQQLLTKDKLRCVIKASNMLLKDVVLENLDEIFQRFCQLPDES